VVPSDHDGESSLRPAAPPVRRYDEGVRLSIEIDREEDSRWTAEALE
jgi:hypothetical protein